MTTLLLAIVLLAPPPASPESPIHGAPPPAHPATRPTSQPTTQSSAPRADERVVTDATLRFHFAVPKTFKDVPQKATGIYVFQMPATGESRRIAPSMIVTAKDAGGTTLDEEVKGRREAIQQHNAGVTFDTDAATTVAGHDGWEFSYATKLNQTVTEQPGGAKHIEQVAIRVLDRVAFIDGRSIEFVITTDDKGTVIRKRMLDRALATLVVE